MRKNAHTTLPECYGRPTPTFKLFTAVCALFLLSFQDASFAQNLEYDIILLGKVGKLNIEKTQSGDYSMIKTNSQVKIPFYKFNWITTLSCYMGNLNSSSYQQLLNDKKREFTEITLTSENVWQLKDSEGKQEQVVIEHPFFVSELYFKEPVGHKFIFSERFAKPLEIINNENGHYTLLLPDGNICEYFYEKGICTIVKAKNGSRTIKMVLNQGT